MGLREEVAELPTWAKALLGVAILSPLVVAAAVVAAAVIGTFVLGIGDAGVAAPQASMAFDAGDEAVTVTHAGGDTLAADRVTVQVTDDDEVVRLATWRELAGGRPGTVEVGDSIELQGVAPGATVTLTLTSADGSETAVVGEATV
jgi:FlaG/FlaF family flagellin (archaellin)